VRLLVAAAVHVHTDIRCATESLFGGSRAKIKVTVRVRVRPRVRVGVMVRVSASQRKE
jgi:hypothetical protein